MNNLLTFSHNTLNLIHNTIHDNIKGSFIDNFIHELQKHLELQENNQILENLSKNTNLHFANFNNDYAICFDYSSKTIYNIPKSYIKNKKLEIGDPIKAVSSKDFCIDYDGIPANINNINNFLNECNYATLPSKINILPEYYKIYNIGIDYAICRNINTNKKENIPIDEIPKNAKNGDTLLYKNNIFIVK